MAAAEGVVADEIQVVISPDNEQQLEDSGVCSEQCEATLMSNSYLPMLLYYENPNHEMLARQKEKRLALRSIPPDRAPGPLGPFGPPIEWYCIYCYRKEATQMCPCDQGYNFCSDECEVTICTRSSTQRTHALTLTRCNYVDQPNERTL